MSDVNETLATRETVYGDFVNVANTAQRLREALNTGTRVQDLNSTQSEALTMICSKLARIVNGSPSYPDSWHDIAGYAKLVEDRL